MHIWSWLTALERKCMMSPPPWENRIGGECKELYEYMLVIIHMYGPCVVIVLYFYMFVLL